MSVPVFFGPPCRCLAHVFNLIGAYISRDSIVKRNLRQLVDLITVISRSQRLVAKLRELGANRIAQPVPTRWYSTSSAINSMLDLKSTLELVPKTNEFNCDRWLDTLEDDGFWEILRNLKVYFDRLSALIGHSEACDSSLAKSFREFLTFGKFIFKTLSPETRFRRTVINAYITHFGRINLDLMLAAYALDPNNRLQYLKERSIRKAKLHMLAILFEMGHDDGAGRLLNREFEVYLQKMKEMTEPIANVHDWWRKSGTVALKVVGMRLAACHASSANTERIFSGLGRIITPIRNRLNIKTVHELMSIRVFNLSRESLRAKRAARQSQAVQCSEMVTDMEMMSIGGHDSEADILDPRLDDEVAELESSEPSDEELLCSTALIEFKSYIDFDLEPVEDILPEAEVNLRSSGQRARELLDAIERKRHLE